MNDEYEKGQEIGELRADIKNLTSLLEKHIKNQDSLYTKMDARLRLCEQWIQTTTGKVVVLTAVVSGIGWFIYQIVSWFIHTKFK